MKKIYTLLFSFISIGAIAQKQPIQLSWLNAAQLYYNGGWLTFKSTAECSDGSVVVAGVLTGSADVDPGPDTFLLSSKFPSSVNAGNAIIVKYSKKGKLVFAMQTEDSSENTYASSSSVAIDKNDNIYIAGSFKGTIYFNTNAHKIVLRSLSDSYDNFLVCYDKTGKLKFAKNITHTNADNRACHANSVAVDNNQNIYVTGDFRGSKVDFDPGINKLFVTSENQDIFFSKYDSLGNLQFVKTIAGYDDDYSNKIAVDNNNNILICGHFSSSTIDFDPNAGQQILTLKGNNTDLFFAKYDSLGNYLFAKNIGKSKPDYASSLAIFKDNSFVITGSFSGKLVDFDPGNDSNYLLTNLSAQSNAFIAKYNAAGNCVLAFSIAGGNSGFSSGNDIACDSAGNIFSTGKFSGSDVDFNPGPDSFFIRKSKYNYDYVAKYNSSGNLLFAEAIGNYNYNTNAGSDINCLRVTKAGQIIITGDYNNSLDVDAGKNKTVFTAPSTTSYISKYNTNGNYLSAISAQEYSFYYNATSIVTASATDAQGNVYVCGLFSGRFDFDSGPGIYVLESSADYRNSVFFAKYTSAGKLAFAKTIKTAWPFNDMAVDKDENIYFTGAAFNNTDFDPSDSVQYISDDDTSVRLNPYKYFFAKYSADGNLIFVKGEGNDYNGNYYYELYFNAIALDNNKNIYLAGRFPFSLDFDPGPGKHILNGNGGSIFYAKYDSSGNYIFANELGNESSGGQVYDLALNSKGNIIITGDFFGDSLDVDPGLGTHYLHESNGEYSTSAFVGKYQSNGKFINAFPIVDVGKDYSGTEIKTLVIDGNDNIYIGGKTYGNVDFDPGKNKAYLPSPQGIFFASYSNNGELRFLKGITEYTSSAQQFNYINSLCLDKYNNIYAAGAFSSKDIDCDPGPDSAILINEHYDGSNNYNADLFIAKYDSLGNYIYSYDFDGDSLVGENYSTNIMVDNNGNINYTGYGQTKLNFGTGRRKIYLQPTTGEDNLFVAQYKPAIQSQKNKTTNAVKIDNISNQSIKVYPNPVHNKLNIELSGIKENSFSATIAFINMRGECLLTANAVVSNHQLQKEISLPLVIQAGNYFIKVVVGNKTYYSNILLKQ